MTGPCFVDANVLVYTLDPRDAGKQKRAAAWRDHLWQTGAGRTSAQVLSETYATLRRLRRDIPADTLWDALELYFAWDPHPIDLSVLRLARAIEHRFRISWWDSMIVAAAQLQDCSTLLTEDLQDGMVFGSVTVRSPFSLEIREPATGYTAFSPAASLHRPRGRPRRAAAAG
jgi:predicted nucleic acid-binding protein